MICDGLFDPQLAYTACIHKHESLTSFCCQPHQDLESTHLCQLVWFDGFDREAAQLLIDQAHSQLLKV